MKILIPIALLVATILCSCKKEKCPVITPPVDISGTAWSGPITVNGQNYTIAFTLRNDGSLGNGAFTPGAFFITGSWFKNPNNSDVRIVFKETATSSNWTCNGTLNGTANKIENIAYSQMPNGFTGTFTVTKQ
jgi:hypothetical protein